MLFDEYNIYAQALVHLHGALSHEQKFAQPHCIVFSVKKALIEAFHHDLSLL